MKEYPLLCSTTVVQSIMEDRKGQTRRIIKPQPPNGYDRHCWFHSPIYGFTNELAPAANWHKVKCPYRIGDALYVRETWGIGSRPDPFQGSVEGIEFKADGKYIDEVESLPLHFYDDFDYSNYDKKGWRPSIHMPKSIARIWLQVIDVRVERLQDISEDDAKAEGALLRSHRCGGFGYYEAGGDIHDCVCQSWEGGADVMGFKDLWCEINGADSWEANPWVWVVSFKVLSTTGKPNLNNQ